MARLPSPYNLGQNAAESTIMYIDMNSSFATIEQQANPLLRGRPIAVSAYTNPRGIIIAPSVEAKRLGIKLGTRNVEAKQIDPNIIILPVDPPKYRDAHNRFKKIFTDYSSDVTPKSIDEAVINFADTPSLKNRNLRDIGLEIKQRIRREIGESIRVNVGISTNFALAKIAAGINKPDNLYELTHENLIETLSKLELLDLPGINVRYERRLRAAGINTPLEMYHASADFLKKEVFQSVVGYHWYLRLRGWEIDDVQFGRKTIGHTYSLKERTSDRDELARLTMKLCAKIGIRLRGNRLNAKGIHVSFRYKDRGYWHKGQKTEQPLHSDLEIFNAAMRIVDEQPQRKLVANLSVNVYALEHIAPEQMRMFNEDAEAEHARAHAIDAINHRYGEFKVTSALMSGMQGTIKDMVAFGGIKDIEDLYDDSV